MKLEDAFTLTSDQDKISTYNIKQTSVEGKKKIQRLFVDPISNSPN